jgi:hypothetical protein
MNELFLLAMFLLKEFAIKFFSSFDEGVVGCYLQWCTIMMMHNVWNMLGCPFFFLEFAKLVSFVD